MRLFKDPYKALVENTRSPLSWYHYPPLTDVAEAEGQEVFLI
jgi:hypothetical protein